MCVDPWSSPVERQVDRHAAAGPGVKAEVVVAGRQPAHGREMSAAEAQRIDRCFPPPARTVDGEHVAAGIAGVADQLGEHALAGEVERVGAVLRSEEHTSELQALMSTSYAVFCLKSKNSRRQS